MFKELRHFIQLHLFSSSTYMNTAVHPRKSFEANQPHNLKIFIPVQFLSQVLHQHSSSFIHTHILILQQREGA